MPRFRKLIEADIAAPEPTAPRAAAQDYDAHLAGFAPGDYGRVELHDDERRAVVRQQLQAAAGRCGLVLRFRSGPGPLTFQVAAAPSQPPEAAAWTPAPPSVEPPHTDAARREPKPQRSARPPRRPTAAERYHEMLPRWMREGRPANRLADRKRRQGR